MKKVFSILLIAAVFATVGVSYETPAKKIASVELPKIEKSYVANVAPITHDEKDWSLTEGIYQDDVYYIETTAVDNYKLPAVEAVFIKVPSPVPLITA